MKNFSEYKCDTCKRTIILENDIKRFFVPKCTITLGCRGTLQKINEQNVKRRILHSSVAGLEDWRPRGTKNIVTQEIKEEKFISLSSGENNEITLASIDNVPSIDLIFNVVKSKSTEYKEYVYNKNQPISQVNGLDDTPEKKLLRFTLTDNIRVFVNGIEVIEGTDWNRNVSTHTILFSPPILEDSSIIVIVSPELPVFQKTLTFNRNTLGGNISSVWGNVNKIVFRNQTYFLYTCNSTELVIDVNTSLTLNSVVNSTISNIMLLLGNKPWNITDRIFTYYGDCNKIINDVANIRMIKNDNDLVIEISEFGISDAFPPIRIPNIGGLFTQEKYNLNNKNGVQFLNTYKNKKILGPV
jgi:hypothetical protein